MQSRSKIPKYEGSSSIDFGKRRSHARGVHFKQDTPGNSEGET